MKKYCFVLNKETGLVQLGIGCKDEYYIEIGMELRDVDQSDIDYQWYLSELCPHKSEEEKEKELHDRKVEEIKRQLNEVDLKSIRAIRANEQEYIEKYEAEAKELREKLKELGVTVW